MKTPTTPPAAESALTAFPRKSDKQPAPSAADTSKLSAEQREAMWHVRTGADISDPYIAKHLRRVEKDFPSLIWIGKPMGHYNGAKHVPYFGAILTAAGRAAIGLPEDFAPHYVD